MNKRVTGLEEGVANGGWEANSPTNWYAQQAGAMDMGGVPALAQPPGLAVPGYDMGGMDAGGGMMGEMSMGGVMGGGPMGMPMPGMGSAPSSFDDEPPLLEELEINIDHIMAKTKAVLLPHVALAPHTMDEADIAGPLMFCALLGFTLLLSGKMHFGAVYGFSVFGCIALYGLLSLMLQRSQADLLRVASVLGYGMIPVNACAVLGLVMNLYDSMLGNLIALAFVVWATVSALKLLDRALNITREDLFWLVAYPLALLYGTFVLLVLLP